MYAGMLRVKRAVQWEHSSASGAPYAAAVLPRCLPVCSLVLVCTSVLYMAPLLTVWVVCSCGGGGGGGVCFIRGVCCVCESALRRVNTVGTWQLRV